MCINADGCILLRFMPSTRSELVALDVFYRALDAGELVTLDVVTRRIEQLIAERRRDGQVVGGAGQPPAPPSPRATVAELVGQLSARDHGLARVLLRCSYLCDGIAIRDPSIVLNVGQTLDVSPPFAGG